MLAFCKWINREMKWNEMNLHRCKMDYLGCFINVFIAQYITHMEKWENENENENVYV